MINRPTCPLLHTLPLNCSTPQHSNPTSLNDGDDAHDDARDHDGAHDYDDDDALALDHNARGHASHTLDANHADDAENDDADTPSTTSSTLPMPEEKVISYEEQFKSFTQSTFRLPFLLIDSTHLMGSLLFLITSP